MRKFILFFVVFIASVEPLGTQEFEHLVLYAVPETRVVSGREGTRREVLAPEDQFKNRIDIVKVGQSYRWKSRENRELTYSKGGLFHSFTDPRGGGWIRVLDQRQLSESFRIDGGALQFFESVWSGLTTITYWGKASEFNP